MDYLVQFFDYVYWFITEGLPAFFYEVVVLVAKHCVYAMLEFKLMTIKLGISVAESIMSDFGIVDRIESAFSSLDSSTSSMLGFFGVPAAIKNIVTALVTRFAMSVLGW